MRFLTKEKFERQNFIYYLRTEEYYYYEDYLKWFIKQSRKMERKSLGIDPESFNPDPSKTYCIWSGGSCGGCSAMAGQIFETSSIPETHPNCSCSCDVIDDLGEFTGEKIKPKVKEKESPKPKEPCAKITSRVNPNRKHPVTGENKPHKGTDISAPKGTPIHSIDKGKVDKSGPQNPNNLNEGFDNRVKIITDYGTVTYAHMDQAPEVKEGNAVNEGDLLGYVGNTGSGTGNHLHYERMGRNSEVITPSDEDLLDSLNANCK